MQVSVEVLNGLERRVTIGVPAESIESEINKRLQQLARSQRLPGCAIAQLRLFPEGEKRFLATLARALPAEFQHVLNCHVGLIDFLRGARECAVVADIAAEVRERNEHFARVRDHVAVAAVAQDGGDFHE